MIATQVMSIDPATAANFLQKNDSNRPLSKNTVEAYANAMKRGEWVLNGEPIVFDKTGRLSNGQHRLSAVIKSGKAIDVLVVSGVSEESFKTFDGGRRRSAGDALAILGEKNVNAMAAGARCYIFYNSTRSREFSFITPTQISEAVAKHPDIRHWAQRHQTGKTLKKFSTSLIGFLTVASEIHGREKLEPFVEKLDSGVNLMANDPAFVLRERVLTQGSTKLKKEAMNVFFIKSINAHIECKPLTILRYSENEELPRIK